LLKKIPQEENEGEEKIALSFEQHVCFRTHNKSRT
jgi:hypothetical protein